jgi:hypothetical protein
VGDEVKQEDEESTHHKEKEGRGNIMNMGVIRLKRIYTFLCSMLVHAPFALCFVYTSWRFYAFSGTNLLTRCHNASSLFSAIFVFQKSYTGNILGIG